MGSSPILLNIFFSFFFSLSLYYYVEEIGIRSGNMLQKKVKRNDKVDRCKCEKILPPTFPIAPLSPIKVDGFAAVIVIRKVHSVQ